MKEITIPPHKAFYWRIVMLLLFPIAYLAYYLYGNIFTSATVSWLWTGLAFALFLPMLLLLLHSISKISDKGHALKLSSKGLDDRASMASPGLIRWDNIIKSELKTYTGTQQLVVYIADPKGMISPLPYFKRNMVQQIQTDLGTPIAINTKMLNYNIKELNKIINMKAKGRKKL